MKPGPKNGYKQSPEHIEKRNTNENKDKPWPPAGIDWYYSDGSTAIALGDCRLILPHLEPVDLVLTDPPYGVGIAYTKTVDNDETIDAVLEIVQRLLPICKRLVLTPGVKNLLRYPQPTHIGSFYYPAAAGCNTWGFSCWQPILFYGKDPYGGKGSRPDSYQSTEAAEQNGHPCPKPYGQWSWLMARCSLEEETILDPFMGSGTTLRAAKDLGRKCIGIEISREYCDIAVNRLRQEVISFE